MYLKRCGPVKSKKEQVYWELVESYRTERGPRQRVVAYLGDINRAEGEGIKRAAEGKKGYWQARLFDAEGEPEWVEVDTKRVKVGRVRDFGGYWLGLEILDRLELTSFLEETIPHGREDIEWSVMSLSLILWRLCEPSSELHMVEHLYDKSPVGELLGIPDEKMNDNRLYRSLDNLLPHKEALEKHLKERLGQLFNLEYDLLLYDVTSTYFEGEAAGNEQAKRGYSRDHRPDCKQVCIALVVSREGLPLGYEVFDGNRHDSTTVEDIVTKIESQYGRSERIWVMDRGMLSEDNMEFLQSKKRRYIIGTPKSQLKHFEQELLSGEWEKIREGMEVKSCKSPDGDETFILCRSADRAQKEKAIHERFEKRIERGLQKIAESCRKRKQKVGIIERRVGRLLGANTRAAGLFNIKVREDKAGKTTISWTKEEAWREWAELSEGYYMLRTNITDWQAGDLWEAYIQLTQAETAFRIQKSDLKIRPIWHQKEDRVKAHILVCFLAYVLWKMLGQMCKRAGLGTEPRKVFDEIAQIKVVDVLLPTKQGTIITRRCISQPTKAQATLLQRLNIHLPEYMKPYNL
ncbi:MAG: IS1634 family transposase [Dehalococcoidales bacterium]|nr:IS1634 family transposase [Dehalococcoidales bacterium]